MILAFSFCLAFSNLIFVRFGISSSDSFAVSTALAETADEDEELEEELLKEVEEAEVAACAVGCNAMLGVFAPELKREEATL